MKKYGKGIALALVFALVFSLFAGLGLYGGSNETMAKAANEKGTNDYWVMEIVPDASVAKFNSLSFSVPDKNVTVITCTPTTLNDNGADFKYIKDIDLFVINQDGVKGGNKSFIGNNGKDLDWNVVYEIFKRVVGVSGSDGKSARYIIDESVFTKADKSSLAWNPRFMKSDGMSGYTNKNSYTRPYNDEGSGSKVVAFSNNVSKLYMMLEIMDPGTFYGLYCTDLHEAQKIDVNNGDFLTYGPDASKICDLQEPDYRFETWAPRFFVPYFWNIDSGSSFGVGINSNDETNEKLTVNQSYKRGYVYSGSLSQSVISGYNSKTFNTVKNNGHTYRIAVIAPNKTQGAGTKIAKGILEAAYNSGESLVGGIKMSIMSMSQFAGDTDSINKYDAIYFENDDNPDDVWARNNNVYGKNSSSQTFNVKNDFKRNNKTTVYYAGLDITDKQKTELASYTKPVVVSNALKSSSKLATSNIKSYLDSFSANGTNKIIDNNNLNVTNLKAQIDSNLVLMDVISTPTLYSAGLTFDWNNQDAYEDYYTSKVDVADSKRYLKKRSGSYYLDFQVNLSSSADLYLYIDSDNDARFDDESSHRLASSASGYQAVSYELDTTKSGAIYWKLEAKNGSKSSYVTGLSAIKAGEKRTLNILQIIPCDESGDLWGNNKDSADVASVSLVLPMKSEIASASAKKRVNGENKIRGNIADYDILAGASHRMLIDTYFDGAIKIQMKGQATDFDHSSYSVVKFSDASGQISKADWTKSSDGNDNEEARPKAILAGAGLFYYFLEKTGMYDLNVLRISTLEFAERLQLTEDSEYAKYRIYQDADNGNIYYMDPTTENDEEPKYVGCDLLFMGGSSRFLDPDSYEDNVFDDDDKKQAWSDAITVITRYLSNSKNPAYIANGVMNPESNDSLSNALLSVMGMNRYGNNDINNLTHAANNFKRRNNGGVAEAVKTNDGAMTMYPYNIPSDMRVANSASASVVYQLALDNSNDISVFFATAGISTGANFYNIIGDAINNYYLYKKGNITFAAMGFNFGNSWGQKAFAIKIPEAALLVNAITNSANPDNNDPPESWYTLKFIDEATGNLIVGYRNQLSTGSTAAKTIEQFLPTGYGWDSAGVIGVTRDNNEVNTITNISTTKIEEAKVEGGKISFKFSDTEGFKNEYYIIVRVYRPDYEIKQRYIGEGPSQNSIIKTDTGYLNANDKNSSITVSLVNDSLELQGDPHISNDQIADSRFAGSTATQSGSNVTVSLKDNATGFKGHYEIIIDVDGPYVPDYANYQIVIKDKNGVVLDDNAASGDLTYDSTSTVELNEVTYNTDAYEFYRVETKDGKGTANTTGSTSNGTVKCTLKDSSGFKNEYVVYVILDPKAIEQPPIPTIKVKNPDKTEYKDGDIDADHDGKPDGIIDTMPSDPSLTPAPTYIPSDPSTGIRYVKYTDYLYPDYETAADGTEKVAESDYLYKVGGQYVMKVVFSIDLGTNSSGAKVPATISVQVNDPTNASKRANLPIQVYQGDKSHTVTDNKIVADGTTYFVEIPITKAYYQSLAAAGELNGIDPSNFGMDNGKDAFGVTIIGTPESGIYGVKTKVNFVKRGMFRID